MPMRGRSNSFGGVSRRGDPVIPRLPEPPRSVNDIDEQLQGYALGVSWPRRLVSQSIERHGIAATRSTLQALNYPDDIINTMFVELGAMDEPPRSEYEGSDIGKIRGYRLGVSWPRKQVIRSLKDHGTAYTRTTLRSLNFPDEIINAIFIELGAMEKPPSSPVYREEDLGKVADEEQGLVDNFELSGTNEEQLETLEIVMSEIKKKRREFRTITEHLMKRFPKQEEDLKKRLQGQGQRALGRHECPSEPS